MEKKYSIGELRDRMKKNWPETVSPETEAVLGLMRLGELVNGQANKISARFGLTPAGFDTLVTLRSLPKPRALSPSELFMSVLISSGGMTKVLDKLEEDGWITRVAQDDDKRKKLVRLTTAGEKLAEDCMAAVMEGDRSLLQQSLSKSEIETLRDLLLTALKRLE